MTSKYAALSDSLCGPAGSVHLNTLHVRRVDDVFTVVYTYDTPLALIDWEEMQVFINDERYSNTSSRHRTLVAVACYKNDLFDIDVSEEKLRELLREHDLVKEEDC